jgi:hypothetical protein
MGNLAVRSNFAALLADVKGRIQVAQTRAVLAVNAELVRLYWDVGRIIDERQKREGWGAAVIPRLARALKRELVELKGFSERNIDRMIAFYRQYSRPAEISPLPVAKLPSRKASKSTSALSDDALIWSIPWAHHCSVVNDRLKHPDDSPTIGLILCQTRDQMLAEYSLAGIDKPIGVSTYVLTRALPRQLQSALPTVEEIETELSGNLKASARTRRRKQ